MIDTGVLRTIDLFSNLDPIHLAHLASIGTAVEHGKNAVLFEEGDDGSHIYVVVSGSVRISKMVPGIGEEALAVLQQGSYFGEMEFIEPDLDRAARAVVHERCTLYAFAYEDLYTLFNADRDFALAVQGQLLRTLARRLRATNDKVTAMFAMAQFG